MLVQCPSCRTTYKVADEVVKGAAAAFRCSRCKHTFELDGGEPPPATPTKPPASRPADSPEPQDRELSFTFIPPPTSPPNEIAAPTADEPTAANNIRENAQSPAEQWTMNSSATAELTDKSFTMPPPTAAREPDKLVDMPKNFEEKERPFAAPHLQDKPDAANDAPATVVAMAAYTDERASIRPYLSLFALLLLGFALLAAMTHAKPAAMERLVQKIPFVGATILKNNHLKDGVLLQSVRTGYQSIQGNREVLVVTGIALNQNPVAIREVKLTGKVFNPDGKVLEKQTIWVGNTISPKIIRGMTVEDIPHLQDLKPLKSFGLPPGDSVPFTIVFLKPAKQAKDFSLEVVLADGDV